jgi:transcriptional regulator with XRE-family HTH domain
MVPTHPTAAAPEGDDLLAAALGRAIKVIRTGLGLDRKRLAKAAGLSYSYLSEIENGRKPASASAQHAIARALGLSPSELLAAAEDWALRIHEDEFLARTQHVELPRFLGRHPRGEAGQAPAPARSARAKQERWFHASSLRPWAQASAEDDEDSLEQDVGLLRKVLGGLSPRDRERVLDLARRLARK